MPALKAQGRRAARVCKATAATEPTHGNGRPGERKGFVEEMRIVAMKLHTRQQAPKEGQAEAREEQQEGMQTVRRSASLVSPPSTRSPSGGSR
jgi:hypothetical protein